MKTSISRVSLALAVALGAVGTGASFFAPASADPVLRLPGRVGVPATAANAPIVIPRVLRPLKITKLPDVPRALPTVSKLENGEISLIREAIDHAKLGKLGPGVDAAVYATVIVSQPNSVQPANSNNVLYAHGQIFPAGSGAGERLKGTLKLLGVSPSAGNPAPKINDNNQQLDFSLDPKGQGSVLWKLNDKAFLGRPAATIDFGSTSKLLFAETPYFGSGSVVTVRLSNSISPLQIEEPKAPPKPAPAPAAKPRGARIRVDTVIKTTNSADGVNDNACEMAGHIKLGGVSIVDTATMTTYAGFKHNGIPRTFDVYFDQPETILLTLSGYLKDSDEWSSDDTMWNATGTQVNLKKLFEANGATFEIPGDRNSESADLLLSASKIADLY